MGKSWWMHVLRFMVGHFKISGTSDLLVVYDLKGVVVVPDVIGAIYNRQMSLARSKMKFAEFN